MVSLSENVVLYLVKENPRRPQPAATFTLIIIYRAAFVKPFAGEKKIFIGKFYATFIFTLAKDRAVR